MKQLTCEMCGGTDLVKQDGIFVCQTCGTKYSVEEAKKMMIEGTVDVSGSTIKVDSEEKLNNLYQLARRARDAENSETAAKYYNEILLEKPNDWEAALYSAYYSALNCKIAEMANSAYKYGNSLEGILRLIHDNEELSELQKRTYYNEVHTRTTALESIYYDNIASTANKHSNPANAMDFINKNRAAVYRMKMTFADSILQIFDDKEEALKIYKYYYDGKVPELNSELESRIKKLDPNFDFSTIKNNTSTSSSGGCYVATAVYGSYDCPQVWTLRRYRDYSLAETWYGRVFIQTYYAISPTLVKWFGHTEWFKRMWKGNLDRMVKNLQEKGYESTPYEDRNW